MTTTKNPRTPCVCGSVTLPSEDHSHTDATRTTHTASACTRDEATGYAVTIQRNAGYLTGAAYTPAQQVAHLRAIQEQTQALTAHYVQQMLDAGATWSRIGDALGVSKQAAQQRYGRSAAR